MKCPKVHKYIRGRLEGVGEFEPGSQNYQIILKA